MKNLMKLKITICSFLASITLVSSFTASAFTLNFKNPELGYGLYYENDGYDVVAESDFDGEGDDPVRCWYYYRENESSPAYLEYHGHGLDEFELEKIKVPDSMLGVTITEIKGSCEFTKFDVNPENEYMKVIDNVVFSKDGKRLMSFAQFDERTVYEIPDGTEIIGEYAFAYSKNLTEIIIPESVKEIQCGVFSSIENLLRISIPVSVETIPEAAFFGDDNLKKVIIPEDSNLKTIGNRAFLYTSVTELTLPSFEVEISNTAFGKREQADKVKLYSYVKPKVSVEYTADSCKLKWDKIPNAEYYEIYQKLSNGKYKRLKRSTYNSCRITVKEGKEYTFAVKAIGNVKTVKSEKWGEDDSPEYFIIEGTMSDDVIISV